jgi:hypothetical protein
VSAGILTCRLGAALALVFSSATEAQVIHVRCGLDELQEVIDAAPAGATIFAACGTPWGAIVIDKPLTLIGGTFEGSDVGTDRASYVTLAGPGTGEVVLVGIHADVRLFGPAHSSVAPGIVGGGFAALHVYDSHVRAAEIRPFDGRAFGQSAIVTTVPLVVIERSFIEGSQTDDSDLTHVPGHDGPPGIDAPGSTVVVLDSIIRGGASGYYTMAPLSGWLCSDLCSFGAGGPGIVADAVFHSGSRIEGGEGAGYDGILYEGGPYGACSCEAADGASLDLVRRAVALPSILKMNGPPRIGTLLTLTYSGPSPAVLIGAFGITSPRSIPRAGWLFLEAPHVAGPTIVDGTVAIDVPANSGLLGRRVAFQAFEPTVGLSRPVVGVLH